MMVNLNIMKKEFFEEKIVELNDKELISLLRLRNEANQEIYLIAKKEATKRNIKIEDTDLTTVDLETKDVGDKTKLDKWSWGAFTLGPLWTLANKLELWTVIFFIPFLNILLLFYLGFKGNRLAYEKSNIDSVDDFMSIQKHWDIWGIRFTGFSIGFSILVLMIEC